VGTVLLNMGMKVIQDTESHQHCYPAKIAWHSAK